MRHGHGIPLLARGWMLPIENQEGSQGVSKFQVSSTWVAALDVSSSPARAAKVSL